MSALPELATWYCSLENRKLSEVMVLLPEQEPVVITVGIQTHCASAAAPSLFHEI